MPTARMEAGDLYSNVDICTLPQLEFPLCMLRALKNKKDFFGVSKEAVMCKFGENKERIEFDDLSEELVRAHRPFDECEDKTHANVERAKKIREVLARCFLDSAAPRWFALIQKANNADELDTLLEVGKENEFLNSFLWAYAQKEFVQDNKDHFMASVHFSSAMVKYSVPLHPHHLPFRLAEDATEEVKERVWSCHFASMHNHVIEVRKMLKKRHAFEFMKAEAAAFKVMKAEAAATAEFKERMDALCHAAELI